MYFAEHVFDAVLKLFTALPLPSHTDKTSSSQYLAFYRYQKL